MMLYDNLIEIGGCKFILDVQAISDSVKSGNRATTSVTRISEQKGANGNTIGVTTVETETTDSGVEVDVTKFEMINNLINTLLLSELDEDNGLGAAHILAKAPMSFKLAFNTLISMGIIKEL